MLIAALLVSLALSQAGCQRVQSDSSHDEDSFKVGVILSLSGTYANLGQAEKNALQLEAKLINEQGGVDGKKLVLILEDDATDEAKAVSAAQKLIQRDKVEAIIGASGTGQSMAIRELIEKARIPQISMAGGSVISEQFSPFVFQTPWSTELLLKELISHFEKEGVSRVALVSDSGGYGKDGRSIALKLFEKSSVDLVLDTTFKPQDTDMSSQVALIKNSKPDVILLWNAGKESSLFVRQLKNAGISTPVYGGSGLAREEFLDGVREFGEGINLLTGKSFVPASWDESDPSFKVSSEFKSRYETEYLQPVDIFAGHAYDALHMLVQAKESGKPLLEALESQVFYGYGGAFEYTSTDHNGLGPKDVSYFHIKQGEWAIGLSEGEVSFKTTSQSSTLDLFVSLLRQASFYALIALGFIAVFIATGAINFAQGEFVVIPALLSASLISAGIPAAAAVALSLVGAALLGVIYHKLLIEPLGPKSQTSFIIVSVGASILLRQFALHLFGPDERSFKGLFDGEVISLLGLRIDLHTLLVVLITLAAFIGFAYILKYTKMGKAMRAHREDRVGATLCGIQSTRIVRFSLIVASMLGALAGLLMTPITQITFESGLSLGVKGFSVAILGGLANPVGAILAALGIAGLESAAGVLIDPIYKDVVAYIALIAALIFKPQGLFSRKEKEKL